MSGLQATYGVEPQNPRVDFEKKAFDDLIQQKGKEVTVEKALVCPCKGSATNAQSNCKNCGGTGWVFINPTATRMIMQRIDLVNDFAPWSEENRGFVSISFNSDEELSFMDKITDVNGISTFSQVLFFKEASDSTVFTYTTYPIKEIKYIGLFKGTDQPLQKLVSGTDYIFSNNVITLVNQSLIQNGSVEDTSITVRYKHSPIFYVAEMKRETMETFEYRVGAEVLKHMPLSAIARRAHYVLNVENLTATRLLSNSYVECNTGATTRIIKGWIVSMFVVNIVDTVDDTKKQTLANGDVINVEYKLNIDGTLTIPYLASGYNVLTPFVIDNNIIDNEPYDKTTGTFDNSNYGGFISGNKIAFNASIPIWQ